MPSIIVSDGTTMKTKQKKKKREDRLKRKKGCGDGFNDYGCVYILTCIVSQKRGRGERKYISLYE